MLRRDCSQRPHVILSMSAKLPQSAVSLQETSLLRNYRNACMLDYGQAPYMLTSKRQTCVERLLQARPHLTTRDSGTSHNTSCSLLF